MDNTEKSESLRPLTSEAGLHRNTPLVKVKGINEDIIEQPSMDSI